MYYEKKNILKGFKDELQLRLKEIDTSSEYLENYHKGVAKAQWKAYRKALQDVSELIDKLGA